MRTYDPEGAASFRPRSDRVDTDELDVAGRAAADGRPDVLGAAGLMALQRTAGNAGVTAMLEASQDEAPPAEERSPVHDVIGSGGSPLDAATQADMEGRFGENFGDVRVHTDGKAHDSALSVSAQAYTVGSDIVFQQGRYDPGSADGQHMLAHELTHVVQQRSGPVDGTEAGGGVRISDPSDSFERAAAANADHVMSAPAPAADHAADHGAGNAAVQRHAEDDDTGAASIQAMLQRAPASDTDEVPEEDQVQTFVQREGEDEEKPEEAT
jgi:hypothetical protein